MNLPTSITYNDLRVRLQNINCCLAKKADKLNTLLTLGKSCTDDVIKLEFAYKLLDILKTYNTNLVLIPAIEGIQEEVVYESQAEANCITMTQLDNILQYLQDYCSICFKEYGTYDSGYIVSNDLGGWVGSNPSLIISTQIQADWDQMDNLQPDFIKNKPEIPELLNLIAGDNITITGTYPNLMISSTGGTIINLPENQIAFGDINGELTSSSLFIFKNNKLGINVSDPQYPIDIDGGFKNVGDTILDGTVNLPSLIDGSEHLIGISTTGDVKIMSETDPVYTSSSWYTTTNNSTNWDTAYGWGNHASFGYLTASSTDTLTNKSGNISMWTNDSGYITSSALSGYMLKSTYDTDNDGVVDSAQSMMTIGRNSTGSTLYKGTVVYISGSTGNKPNFVKALADSESTSAGTFGVIYADIDHNSDGYAVTIGTINTLDTRSTATHPFTSDTLADGDTIYLSPTTAGYITNVKPSAPNHLVYLGKVVRTHPSLGIIVYRVQNGYELEELHNVQASSPSSNDTIYYDSSVRLWKTASLATILGYTPVTNSRTISTTSPLTGGGDLSSNRTFAINQATTSTDGYLSSTDWNTFNGKQAALGYTPVTNARQLTINGTTYDLSANRSWTVSGLPSGVQGDILYHNGSSWVVLNAGTSGYVLTTNGAAANPSWAASSGGFSNPMTTTGDIIYGGSSGTATRLGGNTTNTKKFLRSQGNGVIASTPDWDTISYSDVSGGASRQVLTDINWSGLTTITQAISVGTYSDTLVTITNINTLSGTATFSAISGSVDGQRLRIRFSSSGPSVAKPISFPSGNNFVSRGDTLPTAVVAGKWMVILLEYFAQDSKWGCLAVTIES